MRFPYSRYRTVFIMLRNRKSHLPSSPMKGRKMVLVVDDRAD